MKVPKSNDRRVQRTRKTLRKALVALILERGWDELTVLDVCERADVGRSTFYTHFADKEELLVSGFDDLKKALRATPVSLERSGQRLAFAPAMIEHAHENLRLFRALVGRRSAAVVQRRFRQLVHELIAEELEGRASEPRLEAVVRYLTGAFVELLNWSLDPRGPKPAELEAHYQELSAAVLATLRPRRARR